MKPKKTTATKKTDAPQTEAKTETKECRAKEVGHRSCRCGAKNCLPAV